MRRSKSKPDFLLSWLSGDSVLLNLLKFGDSFDLVRADPTNQTQYLRSVSFLSWRQDHLITQSHFHVGAGSTGILLLYFPPFEVRLGLLVHVLWGPCGFAHLHLRGTCTSDSKKLAMTDSLAVDFYICRVVPPCGRFWNP